MLATCKNEGVGLAIAHERGEQGWRSLIKEGSGYGKKLISDGRRSGYSDEEGNAATLQKKPQLLFWMPTGSASKNQVGIWQFLATKKTAGPYL